jgi:hypothetical protein
LLGLAGVFGQSRLPSQEDPCPDPTPLLDGIWDDATRKAARAAFASSDLAFATGVRSN